MPDGKPFGTEPVSEQEQVQRYLEAGMHDNPDANMNWIREKVGLLVDQLKQYGVTDDKINSVHPYDIVAYAGLVWSGHMEEKLARHASRAQQIAQSVTDVIPSIPQLLSGETASGGSPGS